MDIKKNAKRIVAIANVIATKEGIDILDLLEHKDYKELNILWGKAIKEFEEQQKRGDECYETT